MPENRARYEDVFAGIRIESNYSKNTSAKAHTIRPVYAYLGLKGKIGSKMKPRMRSQYGNIFGVLNNDIKKRTTFTAGDSLYDMGTLDVHSLKTKKRVDTVFEYWEAQILGKVCISDANYFIINCPFVGSVSNSTLKKLKSTGKPVYSCK